MNGISIAMILGALAEMALAHATLLTGLAILVAAELALLLLLRARHGEMRLGLALRWSLGFGVVAIAAMGAVLLAMTKAGPGDLHGWVDYAGWLLAASGLAAGAAAIAFPGFAALMVRRR